MKTILILTLGFVLGIFAAGSVVASGYSPYIVGGNGYLMNVDVVNGDGEHFISILITGVRFLLKDLEE